jgi:dihydropteroate synthase
VRPFLFSDGHANRFRIRYFCSVHIRCNGHLLSLEAPVVMGIINLTPDSFYSNSRVQNEKELLITCGKMLHEGASIIDIGGYSSRPGAEDISESEEIARTIKAVELLKENFRDIIISVDTFRSGVAKKAIGAGAAIINDISSGEADPGMIPTIASLQVPYIMMHKKGTPLTMQSLAQYDNVVAEVFDYFTGKIEEARQASIHDIIVDPGFGFAKNLEQNYSLLKGLEAFKMHGKPILVGLSRKKMIQQVIEADAGDSLNGTTAANTIALLKGANILRVHDVKEAVECLRIVRMLN